MKTIILRLIIIIIASVTLSTRSNSQKTSTNEMNKPLNTKNEIDESINWSRIGHKIYQHFAKEFHRTPAEAKWTMVDQFIYARFKSNNKEVTVIYNKRGRWIRTINM